ncbi:unnamed protein product [Bemisia tabaci]|uniref:Integrator complex subunit 1 n=1 Tax=Bemisia tabaci TaxID=7038 RepID=A0A9P0AF68_BEMTA|nr:unnamed protein product [Bemisia tabaci]
MDRGKTTSGRGKSKTPQFPADLYVLGSKSGNSGEVKHTTLTSKPGTSHTVPNERKREAAPTLGNTAKKPKLKTTAGSSAAELWDVLAIDIDPAQIVPAVIEAAENDEADKVIGFLCGAARALKLARSKPTVDPILTNSLLLLSRTRRSLFLHECVTSAFTSLLHRDPNTPPKSRSWTTVQVISATVLWCVYQESKKWPVSFVKYYIEDALGDRVWVDRPECRPFVANIVACLNTKVSPKIETEFPLDEPELNPQIDAMFSSNDYQVMPRYSSNQDLVESTAVEVIRDQLNRRQGVENMTRNVIKLLSAACGLAEVRAMVAPRLEVWLQNPKLMRGAQELLMAVCVNCTTHTVKDVEVISGLVKTRLKTKALSSFYTQGIREMVNAHPDNLSTAIKNTVYNELSNSRNPNNMAILTAIFQSDSDKSSALLAEIFMELLTNREDYLRNLRVLLREVSRALRSDLNLAVFCRSLMSQEDPVPQGCDYAERVFAGIIDLISLCILLCIGPQARGEKKDSVQIDKMHLLVATMQCDTVHWLHDTAVSVYRPSTQEFIQAIHKVLLMAPPEHYYKIDMWPLESERALYLRLASEVPLSQATLIRLLIIGLSKEHPLSAVDTLELAEQLVKRTAALPGAPKLQADKLEILDLLFNLSAYRHPENIDLPEGYTPPPLAITTNYWKAWIILLFYCAHNPGTFGAHAWEKYPTLRALIEMCITNHFVFPSNTDDLQFLALEKQNILEFESHLAAASTKAVITEQSSLLLSQLTTLDPFGLTRKPPPAIIEYLRSLNTTHRLGHYLCRSRNPDFLLDIIQRHGTSQSMPWLADLVHSSDGSLDHLPVQCLCEFLLSSSPKQQTKFQQLLTHLQSQLTDPARDPVLVSEILDYFLRRLSTSHTRTHAISGLKLILSATSDDDMIDNEKRTSVQEDALWTLKVLPNLPHFAIAKGQIVNAIAQACQVENDPSLIAIYISFLSVHGITLETLPALALEMATLIVERNIISAALLPSGPTSPPTPTLSNLLSIFYIFLNKAQAEEELCFSWDDSTDQSQEIMIKWPTGEECTLHVLIVHAIVILLTYGVPPVTNESAYNKLHYNYLLDLWFPANPQHRPTAVMIDTCEDYELIPDWLKLRMIRSPVARIVDTALDKLGPTQLVLFIQSFGVPVETMSKLLQKLDQSVMTNQADIEAAMIDKSYMAKLLDLQSMRGAVGGKIFAQLLEAPGQSVNPADLVTPMELSLPAPQIADKEAVKLLNPIEGPALVEQKYLATEEQKIMLKPFVSRFFKTLSYEMKRTKITNQTTIFVKEILVMLMKKCSKVKSFIGAIIREQQFSCCLFRILGSTMTKDGLAMLELIAKMVLDGLTAMKVTKHPLINILHQIRKSNSVSRVGKKNVSLEDSIQELKMHSSYHLEKIGRDLLCSETLQYQDSTPLVEAISNLLTEMKTHHVGSTGLFVDWLVQIEPEIIGTSHGLQMGLLFARRDESKPLAVEMCRPYLLTLLVHNASWATLHYSMSQLLSIDSAQKFDPTAVLDFLWALTYNPKLWQGRERYTPKHKVTENLLRLTPNQVLCVVEYIVAEGASKKDPVEMKEKMNSRLSQLSDCICCTDLNIAIKLMDHLTLKASHLEESKREVYSELIVLMYLRVPQLSNFINDNNPLNQHLAEFSSTGTSSLLDTLSHTLITALASTAHVKEWTRRAQEIELCLRKLISSHPLLVLRQLPLLASSLVGRVHLESYVFRSRAHLLLMQQVLSILELLQPKIYRPEYSQDLHLIIHTYLLMFQNHSGIKEVYHMMTKFVAFLQNYIGHDAEHALKYLHSRANLLRELQLTYSALNSVCVLMSGVTSEGEVFVTAATPVEEAPPDLDATIKALKGDGSYTALIDLDHATSKRSAALEPALDTLCQLLSDPSNGVRSLAHSLTIRYIKCNPSAAKIVLPYFIACFDSDSPEIIATACDKLPEMAVCAQEYALPLLKKVFYLGMYLNINTMASITKTISLLNLQSGY